MMIIILITIRIKLITDKLKNFHIMFCRAVQGIELYLISSELDSKINFAIFNFTWNFFYYVNQEYPESKWGEAKILIVKENEYCQDGWLKMTFTLNCLL